ncbi:EcsC family protein [Methylocystis parvus]|uniref:EcsC family protein n=1 Tax=Methylocystis parvus TaxID=134 RepID=A0A6B8LYF7_9HYPH|nr:EcsC family protein [Methylocystis parvus]QGM97417.1 EcsC family protein [Methylocystis parvus]WBJ98668.1 EcsC family protein [Methylocystis parvus OBBP]
MSSSTEKPSELVTIALEWVYDNATSGSIELAESYRLKCAGDSEQGIADLVHSHVRYAAFVGFMTNFGGILNAPIAAPLNLSSVIVIQVRMIAAIAHLRGYALHDRKVKTLVFICLTGSSAVALLQELGYSIGKKLSADAVSHGSRVSIRKFNNVLGRYLAIRYGTHKGFARATPVVGGIVGGAIDASMTYGIGVTAKAIFKPQPCSVSSIA